MAKNNANNNPRRTPAERRRDIRRTRSANANINLKTLTPKKQARTLANQFISGVTQNPSMGITVGPQAGSTFKGKDLKGFATDFLAGGGNPNNINQFWQYVYGQGIDSGALNMDALTQAYEHSTAGSGGQLQGVERGRRGFVLGSQPFTYNWTGKGSGKMDSLLNDYYYAKEAGNKAQMQAARDAIKKYADRNGLAFAANQNQMALQGGNSVTAAFSPNIRKMLNQGNPTLQGMVDNYLLDIMADPSKASDPSTWANMWLKGIPGANPHVLGSAGGGFGAGPNPNPEYVKWMQGQGRGGELLNAIRSGSPMEQNWNDLTPEAQQAYLAERFPGQTQAQWDAIARDYAKLNANLPVNKPGYVDFQKARAAVGQVQPGWTGQMAGLTPEQMAQVGNPYQFIAEYLAKTDPQSYAGLSPDQMKQAITQGGGGASWGSVMDYATRLGWGGGALAQQMSPQQFLAWSSSSGPLWNVPGQGHLTPGQTNSTYDSASQYWSNLYNSYQNPSYGGYSGDAAIMAAARNMGYNPKYTVPGADQFNKRPTNMPENMPTPTTSAIAKYRGGSSLPGFAQGGMPFYDPSNYDPNRRPNPRQEPSGPPEVNVPHADLPPQQVDPSSYAQFMGLFQGSQPGAYSPLANYNPYGQFTSQSLYTPAGSVTNDSYSPYGSQPYTSNFNRTSSRAAARRRSYPGGGYMNG